MAIKLFPPYIEGTLPAFYQSNGTTKIVVSFVMNRGVRFDDIKGLMMKIKSIQSNTYLYSAKNDEGLYTENQAVFTLPSPISSEDKKILTDAIETAKKRLEILQTKKSLLETISGYYEQLAELEHQEESISTRESNKKFYENRIAEICNYYLTTEENTTLTQEEKIKKLEKVKTQKIIELGKNCAYYDIQNVNIAKNFYNIVKKLDAEIVELQSTNTEIVTNQILNAVNTLTDENYLAQVGRVKEDYAFENLQQILFLNEDSDLNRINNALNNEEAIITEKTTELESFTSEDLRPGLFYKVQLAYISKDGDIGQYSTVGVIKYTTMPEIYIEGMSIAAINTTWHEFKGVYYQNPDEGDTSEHVYSYQFDFYDIDHNLIDSSGTLLHNSTTDPNGYQSYDTYYFSKTLGVEEVYYVQYTVTTQNGLIVSSPEYAVMEKFSVDLDLSANLIAELNYDNGYIKIALKGIPKNNIIPDASGHYILARANSGTNFSVWEKILTFSLLNEKPDKLLWRDYTIEQGKDYRYSIQQYNDNGVYSSRLLSNVIRKRDSNNLEKLIVIDEGKPTFADFEDMFLSDGKRQLKIRFNPKVSSFKNDILEQKVDTIGSKYPFFFRNGNVYYKEFQISGLISRLMDEEELFFNWDVPDMSGRENTAWASKGGASIYRYHETKTELIPIEEQTNASSGRGIDKTINLKTNLTSDNMYEERQFKLEVLKWLNNGEPKIFRSPAEGNYIVRLMNVSLSPEDKLSRMLHNFQCTAYEVDDFTYDNLNKNNFLQNVNQSDKVLMYKTIQFYDDSEEGVRTFKSGTIINDEIIGLWIHDCQPGEKFKVVTSDNKKEIIVIGSTGQYIIEYPIAIQSFSIAENTLSSGQITYSYYAKPINSFDDLEKVDVLDIYCKQFINKNESPYKIFDRLLKPTWNGNYYESSKISLNKIYYIKIQSWLDEETYFDQLNIETNNNYNLYSKQGAFILPKFKEEELQNENGWVINFENNNIYNYITNLRIQIEPGEKINYLQLIHCGRNLFLNEYPKNKITAVVSAEGNINNASTAKVFTIPCKLNQHYTFSREISSGWRVGFINKEYPQIGDTFTYGGLMSNNVPRTFNSGNNNFILIQVKNNETFNNATVNKNIIELKSSKIDFEPYDGQTYNINIPEDFNFYGGEIDLLKGQVISKYDENGDLLSSPIIINTPKVNLTLKNGINNLFVYGSNGRANIELSYLPVNKDSYGTKFISVRDKSYFIPINQININKDFEDIENLYLLPQTELEIGYQIINKTFMGETQRINSASGETYYQEYQNAFNAFNEYLNSKIWVPTSENKAHLISSNYIDWANENSEINKKISQEETALLEKIQQAKNDYEIDVIRYRYEVEKEKLKNDIIEQNLIINNNENGGTSS